MSDEQIKDTETNEGQEEKKISTAEYNAYVLDWERVGYL